MTCILYMYIYRIWRNFCGKNISCVKFLLRFIFVGQDTPWKFVPTNNFETINWTWSTKSWAVHVYVYIKAITTYMQIHTCSWIYPVHVHTHTPPHTSMFTNLYIISDVQVQLHTLYMIIILLLALCSSPGLPHCWWLTVRMLLSSPAVSAPHGGYVIGPAGNFVEEEWCSLSPRYPHEAPGRTEEEEDGELGEC